MKSEKIVYLIWWLFFGIGMVLILIGAMIGFHVFDYSDKVETTATIVKIDYGNNSDSGTYTYVEYEVSGKTYVAPLNGQSTSWRVGKEIDIYYDKYDVYDIGQKSIDYIVLIVPGLGLIFALIGGIALWVIYAKKNKDNRLRRTGTRIMANYGESVLNTNYYVNGVSPYYIICHWNNPEDGKKYLFKSKNIWFDPEILIQENNITMLPVYINMKKKREYFVDVDFLTENIVDLT